MEAKTSLNLPFSLALVLAAASGFIALAYEIVWARLFSFSSGSLAPGFAAMLAGYLFGLALGSLLSRRWQNGLGRNDSTAWRALAGLIAASNIVSFLMPPLASWLILSLPWLRLLPLVAMSAALLGITLPLLCHLVISADTQAGAKMSYIYLANIIGSAAGSLITGFVLMEWLTLWQTAAFLLVCGILLSGGLSIFLKTARFTDAGLWIAGLALACCSPWLHDGFYERLLWKDQYRAGMKFEHIIESRHGVISVTPTNLFVYGNGIYDGVIETRMKPGSMLIRPYFVSALNANPKEVLVIGMSAGSWTQILANHPQVEKVTVVEIDPGYMKLVKAYPQVSSLLTNPKVEIHIDDGRRWLRRNPDRHFDVVIMNTSYYWREFTSALLSKEFLQTIRQHLNPDGFAMWNCTGSARAIRTGLDVFPYTLMVANNCVGSSSPLTINQERWAETLRAYRIDGQPVFDLTTDQGRQDLDQVLAFPQKGFGGGCHLDFRPDMIAACADVQPITDDNLGDEYVPSLATFFRIVFLAAK